MNFDRSLFIGKFTQEAKDLIQKLNDNLIELEKDPEQREVIKDIIRVAHTLKGVSKIMRFNNVSLLSHKMEDLLIGIQEGHVKLTGDIIDILFKSTDLVNQCVESILRGEGDAVEMTAICDVLDYATKDEDSSGKVSQLQSQEEPDVHKHTDQNIPDANMPFSTLDSSLNTKSAIKPRIEETIRIGVDTLDNAIRLVGEIAVSHRKSERSLSVLKEMYRLARKHVKQVHQVSQGKGSGIRKDVRTKLIDESLDLLKGIERVFKERRDEIAMREIVINELYEDVLKMRMLPLSTVFNSFPRAVRDMAKYFKKEIELRITGEDTMLDKKIIEKLNAPLIHILRNCIDHGIETPEERIACRKPASGVVSISAHQKRGHIEINITDNGRGVHIEKLKERLIERGIMTREKVQKLEETELINMIFLPGVSTSEIITDISGRGVGMDIVKADIEHLKGSVSFTSRKGQGTSCILTLPMTLTTLRTLIISCQNKLLAIPINSIEETLQLSAHELIEVVDRNAIRLRNQIIYIVNLADVLGLPKMNQRSRERKFILIARTSGKRVGLIVDEILDEQDIVVKQLPLHMQSVKTITGATISSDNTIILILHIPEIVEIVKQVSGIRQSNRQMSSDITPSKILIVEDSMNTGEIEKAILEASGYEVDLAKDGVDALELIENTEYQLIVTDIEMPRMDGFTLTEHVRSMPKCADVPIIIVTSLERESDKKRGIQVGADAYITKSDFEQIHLIETVKRLIG